MEAIAINAEVPSSSNLSQYAVKWRPDNQLQLGEPNYVVAVRQLNPPGEFIISMPVRIYTDRKMMLLTYIARQQLVSASFI